MNFSGSWKSGIVSAMGAFSLALSIEAFRSPLLFWICYILTWVFIGALRLRGEINKKPAILTSTVIYMISGLLPLAFSFFPLSIAMFVVLTNIAWAEPDRQIPLKPGTLGAIVLLTVLAFIIVSLSGYMPAIFIPLAYALGTLPLLMALLNRGLRTQGTPAVVIAGVALIVILAVSGQWQLACGTAGGSALMTFVIRIFHTRGKRRALERRYIEQAT